MSKRRRVFIPRDMRPKRNCSHEWHNVQKKNDVSGEDIRHLLAKPDLKIDPKRLIKKPERHAQGHEDPEQSQPARRSQCTRDKDDRAREQQKTLEHIAESCQRE